MLNINTLAMSKYERGVRVRSKNDLYIKYMDIRILKTVSEYDQGINIHIHCRLAHGIGRKSHRTTTVTSH